MGIYAIGDVQGCREQLEQLLEKIQFDATADYLWFAGDLINRGPDSLGTLELIYSLRDRVKVVLGNHDLHLLALYHTAKAPTPKDTLTEILVSSDVDDLMAWLLAQPLMFETEDYILCHAGLYPSWSIAEARNYACEVEDVLRSKQAGDYFAAMYGNQPAQWQTDLVGMDRLRFITNAFTRMRYCYNDGSLDMDCKKPPTEAPAELLPWFQLLPSSNDLWDGKTLLIGHWASLMNLTPRKDLICLDSGCVWGKSLTAYELTEKRWYQVPGNPSPTYI